MSTGPAERSHYRVDGLTPASVCFASSVADVSEEIRRAGREGLAVIPWGGGTRMAIGNLPDRYDIALDMTGLSSAIEHVPGDMTVIVDAGVRVSRLAEELASAGQRLPFEVPQPAAATIGGSVASLAQGFLRLPAGGMRDWIIGMKVAGGDGTVSKSGGRVVKNVQGFDLHRLHAGALGTLGIILEVAFKLTPLPAAERSVAVWSQSLETVMDVASSAYGANVVPEALAVVTGSRQRGLLRAIESGGVPAGGGYAMLARVAGSRRSVDRQVQELTGTAGAASVDGYEAIDQDLAHLVWDDLGTTPDGVRMSARINVRSGRVLELVNALESQRGTQSGFESEVACVVDLARGSVVAEYSTEHGPALREAASSAFSWAGSLGGDATLELCPLDIKRDADVFSVSGLQLKLMRSMKRHFDPGPSLNPGRFAGRI